MTSATPWLTRLDAVEARLRDHAERAHAGLTDADPASAEQWEAADVQAHLAEFIDYWIPQTRHVIREWAGTPVPFGRTKKDPARIAAIADGRSVHPADLWTALEAGLGRLRTFLEELPETAWAVEGAHPTLGTMPLARILDEFLVGHLEEHAEQLDTLVR